MRIEWDGKEEGEMIRDTNKNGWEMVEKGRERGREQAERGVG